MIKNAIHRILKFFSKKLVSMESNIQEVTSFIKNLKPIKGNFELMRIGSKFDGGYLIPNDLEGIKTCFSPGTSDNCSFELDLAKNYDIKSYMCDWSVENSPVNHKNLIFTKKYLGVINNSKYQTMETWIKSTVPNNDSILQMDIEGWEYSVILSTKEEILSNFRILIIEFHDLDMLFTKIGFNTINSTFEKLLENFMIVHIHPNNCCGIYEYKGIEIPKVMEFTFLNKNRIGSYKKAVDFPHELDSPNTKLPNIDLPKIWFK
ncbi:MAG: FkbM family methyltransferase [Bacteroidota bacterium]|nr:FkbM family methyltransferase [Bacteroidota bacterium]